MNIELVGAPEDVQYFGWAVEHLPEGKMLSGLLAVPNALPTDVALTRVREVYQKYLGPPLYSYRDDPVSIRLWQIQPLQQRIISLGRTVPVPGQTPLYADAVRSSGSEIATAPDELYDADSRMPGPIDDLAYQAMLAGFLGAFDGDQYAIQLLALLLLRGSLNRQLAIGRFFRMLTRDGLGVFESNLPTKNEVVTLAQTLVRLDLRLGTQLPQIIGQYASFASSSSGEGFNSPSGAG